MVKHRRQGVGKKKPSRTKRLNKVRKYNRKRYYKRSKRLMSGG